MPAFLLVVVLYSLVDLYQDRRLAEEQFMKRGRGMAANLAHGSRLGVFAEDRELLESAIGSVAADTDFAYVFIYERSWKILARENKGVILEKDQIGALLDGEKGRLVGDRESFSKTAISEGGRFIEFLAPVLAEQKKMPDEPAFGFPVTETQEDAPVREPAIGAVRLGLSLRSVDAYIAQLLKWRVGFIGAFLILGTITIYAFSRRITRPINRLTDRARQIADGHLDQNIPVDSRDEIGNLAQSFNDMAQSLKENISHRDKLLTQLQELNRTLEDRIQQRTAQIEAVNEELREATHHKSQFLANVNHELRTPVSAIISSARLVLRKTHGQIPQVQMENLSGLLQTAEHLLSLINGLLDLSRIEAGQIEVRVEPVKVDELIHRTASTLEPMLQRDRVRLTREVASNIPVLVTDREKLRQIIFNLLGNAAKFTDEGEIKIAASRQNGSLRLVVSDTGIGMEEEELKHIFEEFRQGDFAKHDGAGLGLAIVKKLVDLLGGEVYADSEAGKGSTFTVMLPLQSSRNVVRSVG